MAVTIDEKPGSFQRFCSALGRHGISEFNYRYSDAQQAHIFVGVQVSSDEDRHQLVSELQQKDYEVADLTENEMAKLHIRHMVGGRAEQVTQEQVFRFEFPERPGALLEFLVQLGGRFNISMFHYRNHGSAFGRVLVGLQVPKQHRRELREFLDNLGYTYADETNNPAYQFFLG